MEFAVLIENKLLLIPECSVVTPRLACLPCFALFLKRMNAWPASG